MGVEGQGGESDTVCARAKKFYMWVCNHGKKKDWHALIKEKK